MRHMLEHLLLPIKEDCTSPQLKKDPKTYEHIDPELVKQRSIVVSDQAGRSNILSRLEKFKIKINKDDPKYKGF